MGQTYCDTCCSDSRQMNIGPTDIRPLNTDAPHPRFAKPVRNMIDVNSRIRQIFARQRFPHITERKGVKLSLFYLFEYGAYYDGDWKNGLPHGGGRLIYDDGSIYEGCFQQGFGSCRKALFIKENGTYYKGQVRMNKAFGEGVLVNEKLRYEGNWDNDLPHGEGQEIYNMVSYYQGNFDKGQKEGFGHYQWNSYQYYEGQFHNNQIHGKGKHITRDSQYQGEFENGQRNGQGKLKNLVSKWVYVGEFKDNKMEGKGVYTWADGTKFEGEFKDNKKLNGKLFLTNGQIIDDFDG